MSKSILLHLFLFSFFSTASAQALFQCEKDSDCQIIDVCGEGYSVTKSKANLAIKTLSKPGCAPIRTAPELESHVPMCKLNTCTMEHKEKSIGLLASCNTKTGVDYEDCVIQEATLTSNLETCKAMGFTADIQDCEAMVQVNLMLEKKLTSDFCDQVHISNAMECWSTLARQDSRPEHCLVFSQKTDVISCLDSPEALMHGEWEKLTPNICKEVARLGLTHWSDLCYLRIALDLDDLTTCEDIETFYPFYQCYQRTALKRNDPELCRMVESRGAYPVNYPKDVFSEEGCRYSVAHDGSYAGIEKIELQ